MQLRNRSIGDETDMWDEEEALIDPEKEEGEEGARETEDTKKGIAGDERNILVLLFLYVLQVSHRKQTCLQPQCIVNCSGHPSWPGSSDSSDPHKQECQLQAARRVQLRFLALLCQVVMGAPG